MMFRFELLLFLAFIFKGIRLCHFLNIVVAKIYIELDKIIRILLKRAKVLQYKSLIVNTNLFNFNKMLLVIWYLKQKKYINEKKWVYVNRLVFYIFFFIKYLY